MSIRVEVEGIAQPLEFPDGTDPTVIQATVKRVVARGSPKIPKDTTLLLGRAREPEELPRPNLVEEAGRGFMDIAQGTKQEYLRHTDPAAAERYTKDVDAEIAAYRAGRGKNAGFDVGRLGGAVLASVPAAAAAAKFAPVALTSSMLGRLVLGGGVGAFQGATEYAPEGTSKALQVGMGTVGGAAGVPLGELMARVAAKIGSAAQRGATRLTTSADDIVGALQGELQQAGIDWNNLGAEVKAGLMQQARRQLSVTGEMSPDQIARKLEMDDVLGAGAGATQSQVTRNPRQWTFERNAQKLEGGDPQDMPLTMRYQAQIQRLQQRLNDRIDETRAKAQNEYQAGSEVLKAVQAKMDKSQESVDALYATWRETGKGAANVKPQRIADELGKIIDEIGVENIHPAVRARLESFGLLDGKQTKVLDINEAEKLRKLIGNNDPGNGPMSKAHGMLRRAVDDAVMDTDVPEVESLKAARAAARARFSERDASNAVTFAADRAAEPDRYFHRFVLNGTVKDLQSLRATLTTGVDGQAPLGTQAWQDVQGQTLRHLMEKATGGKADEFSGRMLEKALKEIGDERLKVIFEPQQLDALRKLSRVASGVTSEPNFASVNHANTAPTMMQYAGDVMKKVASIGVLKPVMLPFVGAYEKGAESIQKQAMKAKVSQALTGEPTDPTGASDRYARLVKVLADRLDPMAAGGATTAILYGTQQR